MPDLLLELFSEEIPARMQAKAADDLRRMVTDRLVAEGLVYEGAKAFATPRRLTLTVHGIPARQSDLKEERKGPRVGGPDAAVQGFLKATGLKSLDEAKIQHDPKKGDFYIALIEKPGRATLDVLADILPVIIRTFPWPKQMRWGERSGRPGALSWVRPLHSIVATFGLETEQPEIVKFAIGGIEAGQTTFGHRFMAPDAIPVRRFEDYEAKLLDARVVLDPQRRKDAILTDAKQLAFAQGFELVEDQVLLDEVSGLVEWPVVLMGSFDPEFLSIPGEVIRATIRNNQKCFVVSDPKTGKLTNKFILTANIEASDGGKAIIAGNERVIRARLSDAKFFYETDLKTKLEDRLPKFENIVFHEKLGTQGERIRRIEHASVAATSEEHYKPQGPADRVPTNVVTVAVALADKIDTLVGFWNINEKPTGSKDPYALRRAALGVIRLLIENNIRLNLVSVFDSQLEAVDQTLMEIAQAKAKKSGGFSLIANATVPKSWNGRQVRNDSVDLLSFFADRLKGQLREQGARYDLVDAVFALEGQDDLLMIVRRVEALGKFLDTDDGKNLLAGTKRAANILRIEEKKDGKAHDGAPDAALYSLDEEKTLAKAIDQVTAEASAAVAKEDFAAAMSAMAKLRPAVDAFFDKVKVNDDDAKVRENRLKLLNEIRAATRAVADFSRIQD